MDGTRRRGGLSQAWAACLVCAGLVAVTGCEALDPVETTDLCAAQSGIVSRNCAVCQAPPYAATCPQCQAGNVDRRCRNATDAGASSAPDAARDAAPDAAGASADAAMKDAASVLDIDAAVVDAATDAGAVMDASVDAMSPEAGTDATTVCGVCSGSADLCDTDAMVCVQCLRDEDCDGDDICSDAHTCVKCTGTRYDNCGKATDDTPYVCDSEQQTCTKKKQHSAGDCAPCVSDAHCLEGQLCAPQTFGNPPEDVGNFCVWKRSAAPAMDCDAVAPLVKVTLGVVSVDGVIAEACLPRVSSCAAINDVTKDCESVTVPGTADHALCGFTHSQENYVNHEDQDGHCVDTDPGAGTSWKCTVPCAGDGDCKSTLTCDTVPTPDLCTL
jgi:hypothetical protein